jgi:tetratricopeptide (TPR) repeat protein
MGRQVEAVADYEKTLQLNPGFVRAWDNLAWLLATSDKKEIRDPQRAITLSAKACELSEFKDWTCLNTLATCSSENQDFESAVKWAKAARAIAPAAEHLELDQVVSTYESKVQSKRVATKPGGAIR